MKPTLLMAANYVILDSRTNNASLINVIEEVQAIMLPAMIPTVNVYSHFVKEEGDNEEETIDLKLMIGQLVVTEYPIVVNFQGQKKARAVVEFQGLAIPASGELIIGLFPRGSVQAVMEWKIPVRMEGSVFQRS